MEFERAQKVEERWCMVRGGARENPKGGRIDTFKPPASSL